MTTANLSVGINTESAKASLLELRKALASSVNQLAVAIDPASIDRQIAGFFKQRTFSFKLERGMLKTIAAEIENEVGVGLAKAFHGKDNRELRWNQVQFANSLGAALKQGFDQKGRILQFDREGFKAQIKSAIDQAFDGAHVLQVAVSTERARAEIDALSAIRLTPLVDVNTTAARAELELLAKQMVIPARVVATAVQAQPQAQGGLAQRPGGVIPTPLATLAPTSVQGAFSGAPIPRPGGIDQAMLGQVASTINSALTNMVDRLTPTLDQLGKAAASVGSASKKLRAPAPKTEAEGEEDKLDNVRVSRSRAALDPTTGDRLTRRENLPAEQVDTTTSDIDRLLAEKKADDEAARLSREALKVHNARKRSINAADDESEKLRKQSFNSAFDQIERDQQARKQADLKAHLKQVQKDRKEADAAGLVASKNYFEELNRAEATAKAVIANGDKRAMKNLAYDKPDASSELVKLRNQVSRATKASYLVDEGKDGLARKQFGKAVDNIPALPDMRNRITELEKQSPTSLAASNRQEIKSVKMGGLGFDGAGEAVVKLDDRLSSAMKSLKAKAKKAKEDLAAGAKAVEAAQVRELKFGDLGLDSVGQAAIKLDSRLNAGMKNLANKSKEAKALAEGTKKLDIQNLIKSKKAEYAETHTSLGQAIAAYNAVSSKFGKVAADKAFNNDWISRNADQMDRFRVKVQNANGAALSLAQAMRNAYNSSKWMTEQQKADDGKSKYTARGNQVAGAVGLIQQFGTNPGQLAKVQSQLNNDALFNEAMAVASGTKAMSAYERAISTTVPKVKANNDAHKEFTRSMNDAHSAARGMAGSLNLLWLTWGSTVPIVAGAALAASMREVFLEGKRVEYQLAFVKGLSGTTISTGDFDSAMKGSLFGAKEGTEALRALSQSGLSANEAISALPEVLRLATVGEISVAEAAFAATGVMKAFGLSVGDLGRVSDVMAKAAASSNASVQDMMESFKYASAASSLYGVTLEETGAALARLSEKNIKGSMAGTAHMNLLREIYTPTDKAAKAFAVLGLNMQDMQRQGMNSVEMIDAIRDATAKLDSSGLRAFTSAVGGERGSRELAELLKSGSAPLKEMQNELEKSKGFTSQVMAELQNTVEGSLARLKQSMSFAFSDAFSGNQAAIQRFIDTLANAFSSEEFKKFISDLAGGVVNLTRLMTDHADTMLTVAKAYLAIKVVSGVASIFGNMTASIRQTTLELNANSASMPRFIQMTLAKVGVIDAATLAHNANTVAIQRNQQAQAAAQLSGLGVNPTSTATAAAAAAGSAGLLARAMGGASTALGLVTRGLSFLAGPIGIVIGLVGAATAAWELYRGRQDAASESADRAHNAMRTTNSLLDQEIERLQRRNAELKNPGKSADQVTIDSTMAARRNQIISIEAAVEAAKNPVIQKQGSIGVLDQDGKVTNVDLKLDLPNLQKQLPELKKALQSLESRKREADRLSAENSAIDARSSFKSWLESEIGTMQARVPKTSGSERQKLMAAIDSAQSKLAPAEMAKITDTRQVDKLKREMQKTLDTSGVGFVIPESSKGNPLAAVENAQLREQEAVYKRQAQMMDAKFKAEEVILRAKEKAKLISVEEYEQRYDALTKSHTEERLNLARTESERLKELAAKSVNLSDPDRTSLNTRLKNASEEADRLAEELKSKAAEAAIKVEGAIGQVAKKFDEGVLQAVMADLKSLRDMGIQAGELNLGLFSGTGPSVDQSMYGSKYMESLNTDGMGDMAKKAAKAAQEDERRENFERKLSRKFNNVSLRGEGAKDTSVKAGMVSYNNWQAKVEAQEVELLSATNRAESDEKRKKELKSNIDSSMAGNLRFFNKDEASNLAAWIAELEGLEKAAEGSAAGLERLRQNLAFLKDRQAAGAQAAAAAAADIYERNRSPEAGLNSFWTAYRQEAGDSAKYVNNIMNQSFSSMEQGLMQFVTTGKLSFKSLVGSILADAARMMANQAIKQLLSMGLSFLGNAIPGAMAQFFAPNTGGAIPGGVGAQPYANGGIMTTEGNLPLRRYANGGIAHTPQLSLFGEGRLPEAYVPLPDGRTIPVTMTSDGGGSGGGNVVVNNNITISSDGESKVSSDASGTKAAQLAKGIEAAVMQVIVREKRAGGLLAA